MRINRSGECEDISVGEKKMMREGHRNKNEILKKSPFSRQSDMSDLMLLEMKAYYERKTTKISRTA